MKFIRAVGFLRFIEIIVDEILTRNIESTEDALGNEVYYFYSKTNRKLIDRQNDFYQGQV